MANIRTSLPVPTQPWEAAKARFTEGLTAEESKRFKEATPENLFYETSAAQKRHADNSRSWLLQERISSLVDAIDDYGKALDVYANTYGLVMSPLWGSLRTVLHVRLHQTIYLVTCQLTLRQIAGEAGKFQERLTDMLAQIGDVLPRFHIYQIVFRNHEKLLLALSDAFLDVLNFCVITKDFFAASRKSLSECHA
jgi:hypothetical protein